jgi:hypothetical protein
MLLHQQEWNYSCGAASAFPAAELSRPEHGIPFSSRLAVQARRNTKTIVEKNNDWLKIDKFSARVKHVGCAFLVAVQKVSKSVIPNLFRNLKNAIHTKFEMLNSRKKNAGREKRASSA